MTSRGLSILLLFLPTTLLAQTTGPDPLSVEIDWFHEMTRGGNTGIALFLLAFIMVTIAVERALNLRQRRIIPDGFADRVQPLFHASDDDLRVACDEQPSTIARMTLFLADHRGAPADLLIQGASDIAARELLDEQRKGYGLAVIAALAPLLGLLGTIIGMIESFKLVELYGDDGGASVLAGSISKALVTTALGLIIAIPSLGLYHLFRLKLQSLGRRLDEEMERLVNAWLLKPGGS